MLEERQRGTWGRGRVAEFRATPAADSWKTWTSCLVFSEPKSLTRKMRAQKNFFFFLSIIVLRMVLMNRKPLVPFQGRGYRSVAGRSEVKSLSCVRLSAAPWTVARQAPLSMGFSRQEYCSGSPFASPGHLPGPREGTLFFCIAGRFFTI